MANKAAQKKEQTKPKKKGFKWLVTLLWLGFLIGIGLFISIFYLTKEGFMGEMPNVRDLENPDINVSSQIISADGKLIGSFEAEKRIPVTYQDLPPHLVDALLAKEDIRFYDHPGIDIRAIARAAEGVIKQENQGGGSTLTQQLAKMLFTGRRSSSKLEAVKQKLKEWVVAVQLERLYTKDEVIAMYLNKFDFLYGAHGVEMAAKVYFNSTTKNLTVDQSAMLVAMFRSPWLYNPLKFPEKAKQKRNLVIDQMVKYNKLTPEQGNQYKNKPLGVNYQRASNSFESFSGYYKHALKKDLLEFFDEYEKEYGKKYNLYKDGLKIYITLDSRMQEKAEKAVQDHLTGLQRIFNSEKRGRRSAPFERVSMQTRYNLIRNAARRTDLYKRLKSKFMKADKISKKDLKDTAILRKLEDKILLEFKKPKDSIQYFSWKGKFFKKDVSPWDSIVYHKHIMQSGMMSMDPKDGTIKAWVGGIDWDYFKYDHVRQAKRQVGSTFKPIVYATAINQMNYTPCHTISNATFKVRGWRVPGRGGSVSLRQALAKSLNPVAARLIAQTGPEPVIKLARDMGIENHIQENDFTIALGSADLTVYEMVGALSTLANQGIYVKPQLILRIEDESGKIIKDYTPETREVLNEYVAYTMIDIMKGVTVAGGTAKNIRKYGLTGEIAGKTGTTNDNSDGWFIGLTPNLVTGVWVGNEDRYARFRSNFYGQGAQMAGPIFGRYMKAVYSEGKKFGITQKDKFEKPEDIDERWDCGTLQGFNTYGSLGGVYDTPQTSAPTRRRTTTTSTSKPEESVNDAANADDNFDF